MSKSVSEGNPLGIELRLHAHFETGDRYVELQWFGYSTSSERHVIHSLPLDARTARHIAGLLLSSAEQIEAADARS